MYTISYHQHNGAQQRESDAVQLPWSGGCSVAPSVDGLIERSTMLGLNMYATAENGALSSAASLSIPDAGIISLRGKTWLTSTKIGGYSSTQQDTFTTFTPSTGGAGGNLMDNATEIERAQEEASRERSRRRADGKVEMNLLASLLGRAVRCVSLYSSMSLGTLYILKHTICDFFQDRRVKVSIFLQEQVQNNDGTFKIRADGPLPPNAIEPGPKLSEYGFLIADAERKVQRAIVMNRKDPDQLHHNMESVNKELVEDAKQRKTLLERVESMSTRLNTMFRKYHENCCIGIHFNF